MQEENQGVMRNTPNPSQSSSQAFWWGKAIIWSFFGLAFVAIVVLLVLALREDPQVQSVDFDRQTASVLASLSPEVTVRKPDANDFVPVDESEPIEPGTEIRTGSGGQAVLFSGDGVLTTLEEDTRVVLESAGTGAERSRLRLLAGGLWARVEKAFSGNEAYEIQTANAVTSVRGTEFSVTKEDDGLSVSALRGEVAVGTTDPSSPTTTVSTSLISGEQAKLSALGSDGMSITAADPLGAKTLRQVIANHNQVDQLLSDPQLQQVSMIMDGVPTVAAGADDSEEFTNLEGVSESLHDSLFADGDSLAENSLLRAQERLQEARRSSQAPQQLQSILENYREDVSQAASEAAESDDAELQQVVADATRQYKEVLSSLMTQLPQSAQSSVQRAQSITENSHQTVVSALSSTDPSAAHESGLRTIKSQLRGMQKQAALGDDPDVRNALRSYDRMMRETSDIAEATKQPDQNINFAEELRKSLTVVDTVEKFDSSFSPGIRRAVNEVENRTVDTQLASIASVATSSPERAAEVYEKTTNAYLDKMERATSSEEVQEDAEVYNKYADFGEDLAISSARDPDPESQRTREVFQQATDRHTQRLREVQQRVEGKPAENAIEEAVNRQEDIQRGRPFEQPPGQQEGPGDLPGETEEEDGSDETPADDLPGEAEGEGPDETPADDLPDEAQGEGPGETPADDLPDQAQQGEGQPEGEPEPQDDLDEFLNQVKKNKPQGDPESLQETPANQSAGDNQQQNAPDNPGQSDNNNTPDASSADNQSGQGESGSQQQNNSSGNVDGETPDQNENTGSDASSDAGADQNSSNTNDASDVTDQLPSDGEGGQSTDSAGQNQSNANQGAEANNNASSDEEATNNAGNNNEEASNADNQSANLLQRVSRQLLAGVVNLF